MFLHVWSFFTHNPFGEARLAYVGIFEKRIWALMGLPLVDLVSQSFDGVGTCGVDLTWVPMYFCIIAWWWPCGWFLWSCDDRMMHVRWKVILTIIWKLPAECGVNPALFWIIACNEMSFHMDVCAEERSPIMCLNFWTKRRYKCLIASMQGYVLLHSVSNTYFWKFSLEKCEGTFRTRVYLVQNKLLLIITGLHK